MNDRDFEIQVEDLTPREPAQPVAEEPVKLPRLTDRGDGGGSFKGGFGPDGPLSSPWATIGLIALILIAWLASVDQQLKAGFTLTRIEKEMTRGNKILDEQNTTLASLKSMESIIAEAENMWHMSAPDPLRAWKSEEGFRAFPAEIKRLISGEAPLAAVVNDPARARETLVMLTDPPATFSSIAREPEKQQKPVIQPVIIREQIVISFEGED